MMFFLPNIGGKSKRFMAIANQDGNLIDFYPNKLLVYKSKEYFKDIKSKYNL